MGRVYGSERLTANIVKPLNLSAVNLLLTPQIKAQLATMHQRWPGDLSNEARKSDHISR